MMEYLICKLTGYAIVLQDSDQVLAPIKSITSALYSVFAGYGKRTRPSLHRWFKRFILDGPSYYEGVVNEDPRAVRARLETMLMAFGCKFDPNRHEPDTTGRLTITRPGKSTGEISTFVSALGRFYLHLHELGVRSAANPMLVDHPESHVGKLIDIMCANRGLRDIQRFIWVRRYVTATVASAPPAFVDPCAAVDQILEAGRNGGWPESVQLLAEIMSENGNRVSEGVFPSAWHWFSASNFGRMIETVNAKNAEESTKKLTLSERQHQRLVASFDGVKAPGFAELQRLSLEDPDALRTVPLFRTGRGAALSVWSFRNRYFRAAARDAGIWVVKSDGSEKAPTPHLFRHGFFTREVQILDLKYPNPEDEAFQKGLEGLARRARCSVGNVCRYAQPVIESRDLAAQLKTADDNRAVTLAALAGRECSPVEKTVKRLKAMAA